MDEMFRTQYLGKLVKNCYIFTRNRQNGLIRLDELIEEKMKQGVYPTTRRDKCTCEFSDGENWTVTASARGRSYWDKCIVDATSITIEELECNINKKGNPENIEYWYY